MNLSETSLHTKNKIDKIFKVIRDLLEEQWLEGQSMEISAAQAVWHCLSLRTIGVWEAEQIFGWFHRLEVQTSEFRSYKEEPSLTFHVTTWDPKGLYLGIAWVVVGQPSEHKPDFRSAPSQMGFRWFALTPNACKNKSKPKPQIFSTVYKLYLYNFIHSHQNFSLKWPGLVKNKNRNRPTRDLYFGVSRHWLQ